MPDPAAMPDEDYSDQTGRGLLKRKIKLAGFTRALVAEFNALRLALPEAEEAYQAVRSGHPEACGGQGDKL